MNNKFSINNLTDEEVLKEFVKRFQCDGAILLYLDSNDEFGFGRWRNKHGRQWVNNFFKEMNKNVTLDAHLKESGATFTL